MWKKGIKKNTAQSTKKVAKVKKVQKERKRYCKSCGITETILLFEKICVYFKANSCTKNCFNSTENLKKCLIKKVKKVTSKKLQNVI